MKKIFSFAIFLFSISGFSQGYQPFDPLEMDSTKVNTALHLPFILSATDTIFLVTNPNSDKVDSISIKTLRGLVGGDVSTAWGDIVGTLSDQIDLQSALNSKLFESDTAAMLAPYAKTADIPDDDSLVTYFINDEEFLQNVEITSTNNYNYLNDSLTGEKFRSFRGYFDSLSNYSNIIPYNVFSDGLVDIDPRNAVLTDSLVDQVIDGFGLNNFTSSGTGRPYIIDNYVNGRPVIKFDGLNDSLVQSTAASNFNTMDGYTWFWVVYKPTTQANSNVIMRNALLGTNAGFSIEYSSATNKNFTNIQLHDGTDRYVYDGGSASSIRFQIISARYGESSFTFREGLTTVSMTLVTGGFPVGNVTPSDVARIGIANNGTRANNFYLARAIGFKSTMTDDQMDSVILSLASEYAIEVDTYTNVNDFRWQNSYNVQNSGVITKRPPFSFYEFNTDAEKIKINWSADNYAATPLRAYIRVLIDDKVYKDIFAENTDFEAHVVALPPGNKKVTIIENNYTKPSGSILGTRVGLIELPTGSSYTKIEPSDVDESFVFIGNSITNGATSSDAISQGFSTLFRYDAEKNVGVIGWGYGGLYDIVVNDSIAGVLSDSIATMLSVSSSRKVVVIALGTNDYAVENGKLKAGEFGTLYSNFVDSLKAKISSVEIYAITPIVRTDRTNANQFGDFLQDYRDTITEVLAGVSDVTVIDGTTLLEPSYLSDGVHPTTEGHRRIYTRLRSIILTEKQTVPLKVKPTVFNDQYLYNLIKEYSFTKNPSNLNKEGASTDNVLYWDGSKWAPTPLRTINGNSLIGSGEVTDLDSALISQAHQETTNNYTLTNADAGKLLVNTSATNDTVFIPTGLTWDVLSQFVGFECHGAGSIVLVDNATTVDLNGDAVTTVVLRGGAIRRTGTSTYTLLIQQNIVLTDPVTGNQFNLGVDGSGNLTTTAR